MFRKKFYLTLNLLLGGSFLVTQGLTSCDATKEQFSIFLTQNYDGGGIVTSNKTQGEVGETVKIEVELNDGYTVAHIKVNGEIKSEGVTSFEFQPVAGENKVEVVFADENGTIIDPGAKPVKGEFQLNIVLNGNHGKVEADKIKGKVGEEVTVTITPDPGYEIEAIEFNKEEYGLETRTFTPVEGKNTLKVSFVKVEEVHNDWTLEVTTTEGGSVVPSATEGKKGEKIEMEVTTQPEYVLDKITFNGKETSKDDRVFEPVDGVNKLEVTFVHESTLSKLDKGFELTGKLEKEHETDIKTNEEFIEVLNQLETFNKTFNFVHGEWEYSVNNHPEFAKLPQKTGVTKQELLDADAIVFNGTLEKIAQNKIDWTNKEEVKSVMTYFKNVIDNVSLPVWYTCVSAFYFGTTVIVNKQYDDNSTSFESLNDVAKKDYILNNYSHIEGLKEYVEQFNVETSFGPKDGNYFDENLQHDLYILCEFGYKLWTKTFAITRDVDSIAKHAITLFKYLQSGSFEGMEKEFLEACNFFGTLITEGFCNKDSFSTFISAFGFIDNMSNDNVAWYTMRNSYDGFIISKYKELLPNVLKDIHHLYRTIKFVGFIAKDLTLSELNFVKVLLKGTQEIKYGESFVHASKAFMRAYVGLGNEALLIKEAIPHAIEKVNYIFKNVINNAYFEHNSDGGINFSYNNFTNVSPMGFGEITSELNLDKILDEIDKASKLDVEKLTEGDETYYRNFVENDLLAKVQYKETSTTYKLVGKQDYKLNEKLDLTLYKTELGKETEEIKITEDKVRGFSTKNKKTDVLIFKLDECRDIAVPYTVDNKITSFGIYDESQNNTYYLPNNFDFDNVTFKDAWGNNTITTKILGVDKTKTGEQFVAIKFDEQFLFGKIYLYNPNDLFEFYSFDRNTMPLNVEVDFSKIEHASIYKKTGFYANDELVVVRSEWYENLNEDCILGVNGTDSTKYTFEKEGYQKLSFEYLSEKDKTANNIDLIFNVKQVIAVTKRLSSADMDYYNFIGAQRLENKTMQFREDVNYQFDQGSFTLSETLNLKAADFKYNLDFTKSESQNNGYATDYYKDMPFGYSLYHLRKEMIDTYFLGYEYDDFSFIANCNYDDYFSVSKGTYYVYEDYNMNGYISSVFLNEYTKSYSLEEKISLDTLKPGEKTINAKVRELDYNSGESNTIDAKLFYNVVEPIYIQTHRIYVQSRITGPDCLPDDEVLFGNKEMTVKYITPYTKEQRESDRRESIKDITFGEIKDLIDYSYPPYKEQEIDFVYRGEKVKLIVALSEY